MKTTTTTIATHQPSANPRHSSITRPAIRRCQSAPATVLSLLAALLTCLATPTAHAAALTWDITSGDGAAITAGSGNWNTTAGNTVWNNAGANVAWTQTSTTDGANTATFAGADGTLNQYVVTLGAQMATESITFNSSGYQITGSTLALMPTTTTSGPIDVAAGKTVTINSILRYAHNTAANVSVGSGSTLNLGGGTTASFNPQFNFSGAGTINLTAGTFNNNIGNFNNAVINLTGGTHAITPGNNAGANIGNNAGQSVNYTISGTGTLTVNGNANTPGVSASYLSLGKLAGNTAYQNTLTVQNGATVNIGTTASRAGELRIASDAVSSGKLDVQGGTVTIGTGDTANKIYFFKGGSGSGYTATMAQSGGTVTANGIQFGDTTGTYDANSSATLQLSGGSLYVGAQGITLGSAASALPVTIQLQGGTLGADQNWSSSLDMKLGTTGGGPTIRAQNSASTARNITLSGILSDDGAVNGTLTKTGTGTLTLSGANTFSGPTLVSAGTLNLGKVSAVSSSSSVTIASGAALALSTSSSTVPNLTFANTGTLSFNVAGGYSLTVSGADGVTNSGAAGSITINISGSAPADGTYTLISYSGTLQGSGFSAYTLGTTPAGKTYTLNDSGSAVQLIVSNPYTWTGAQSSEWSTATIAGSKNWTQGGSPADYANGSAVVFDGTASGYTVDISVADVTPASVSFNNNGGTPYTLQGSKAIAGATSLINAGSQTLTILNTNTYTGVTTIGACTLQLGDGTSGKDGTIANSPTVANSGALVYNRFGTNFYGGVINGSGSVTKAGNGTQILTGTNTYTGVTAISGGTLEIGGNGLLGNGTYANDITFANGANLKFSSSRTNTLQTGVISGDGSITLDNPTGKLILAGANTYSGGVTIKNGTLESKTTQTTLGTGTVVMGGAGSSGATFITGQPNTNAFTINAPDSGTNIIGANGAGSGFVMSGPVTLNGDLMVQSYFSSSLQSATARPILNGGMTGTGNLILNNLSGGTNTITLGVNPINHTGSITVQGGSLGSNVISAVIGANVAGVTQNSATSPLILSATNTYTGPTTISAGTLKLSGSGSVANTPTISIAAGATFSIAGLSGGGYSLTGSSPQQTLACSSSSGTATADATGKTLTLAPGALATFKADGTGAGTAGKISVTGDLTLNANAITVNVVTAALGVGSYRLLECLGTLANSGTFGAPTITGLGLASGKVASLKVVTGAAGYVDLVVTTPPVAGNDNYSVLKGIEVKFKKSELLSNDSDDDGDTLSITAFSTSLPGGRTLTASDSHIFYPGTVDANDSFTYTVSDGKGGTATATVNITALASVTGQATEILNASGAIALKFAGIPGYTYTVERATDSSFTTGLTTLLTTNLPTSPAVGVFSYTDSSPPNPQAYYRLKYTAP